MASVLPWVVFAVGQVAFQYNGGGHRIYGIFAFFTAHISHIQVLCGVTLGYLEQNAKLDPTLDIYGEMRATFAPVLDAMAQMQVLERKMAAQPDNTDLLAQHDALQNIVDAADGYNMDVNIKKVLSGMGFAQDTWEKNIAVLSGGELTLH